MPRGSPPSLTRTELKTWPRGPQVTGTEVHVVELATGLVDPAGRVAARTAGALLHVVVGRVLEGLGGAAAAQPEDRQDRDAPDQGHQDGKRARATGTTGSGGRATHAGAPTGSSGRTSFHSQQISKAQHIPVTGEEMQRAHVETVQAIAGSNTTLGSSTQRCLACNVSFLNMKLMSNAM